MLKVRPQCVCWLWLFRIGSSTVCHYFYSVRHWGWGWGLPSSEWHHMVPWAVPWLSPASTGTSPLSGVLTALPPANPTDQPCGKATVPFPSHIPSFSTFNSIVSPLFLFYTLATVLSENDLILTSFSLLSAPAKHTHTHTRICIRVRPLLFSHSALSTWSCCSWNLLHLTLSC